MRRYLVVDDNAAFAENLAEILRDTDAEVTVAPGGERAIELVRAQQFDALVTDMRMPVMNGAQLVHEIRRIDAGLPAIVVTAYTGEDDLMAARHEGLLAVLPKPVPIPRLIELVERARRGGLVAVVEDDNALADNLSELLRERGFSAVTASSVAETDRLGGIKPFVALADLRVPGGDDGEALRRLLARFPGLPTFVITGYANAPGAPAGLRVFQKPFDSHRLLGEVEKAFAEGSA